MISCEKLLIKCHLMIVLFSACVTSKIDKVLDQSGSNSIELERVINYFSEKEDSLKLQAALFLIENMPGHYVAQGANVNDYRLLLENDTTKSYLYKKTYDVVFNYLFDVANESCKSQLIEIITSAYLISYIEQAVDFYKNDCCWLHDCDFQLFLEYVLPFIFENESFDNWRDSLYPTMTSLAYVKERTELSSSITSAYRFLKLNENQELSKSSTLETFLGKEVENHCFFSSI